jgi:hypothetical protein
MTIKNQLAHDVSANLLIDADLSPHQSESLDYEDLRIFRVLARHSRRVLQL